MYLEYTQQHSLIKQKWQIAVESSVKKNYNMHVCENNSFNELMHKFDKNHLCYQQNLCEIRKYLYEEEWEMEEADFMYLQNFGVYEDKSIEC